MVGLITRIIEIMILTVIRATAITLLVLFLFALILHILLAIGLKKIADESGTKNSWMAYVPILNIYIMGKMAYGMVYAYILLILSCISTFYIKDLSNILPQFVILMIVSITILGVLASIYRIYKKASRHHIIMFIFTILSLGLLSPFFLFAIRRNPIIE